MIKSTGLDETPLERFVFDFEWLVDDSAFTGEDFRCGRFQLVDAQQLNDAFDCVRIGHQVEECPEPT